MEKVINRELRQDDSGRNYYYTEFDKCLEDGTPYNIVEYEQTYEERAISEYESTRAKYIAEIAEIKDDIALGDATEADFSNKQAEWATYKAINYPY